LVFRQRQRAVQGISSYPRNNSIASWIRLKVNS
jgi:hypothetical protein